LAEKIGTKPTIHRLFYILFFFVLTFLIWLPIDFFRGFLIEHNYGFSNQSVTEWFIEGLKSLGVSTLFLLIVITSLYWLINRFKMWWIYFSIGALPFAIIMIIVLPVLVDPIFNEFKPLKDEKLRSELMAMAGRAGIENPDIFQVDASKQTKKVNAYFTGMLGTKRIVLYDNMINNFSDDEIKFVMGHEIGHYKMNHIWKGLMVAIIIVFVAAFLADKLLSPIIDKYRHKIGFDRLGDIASVPLLFLYVTVFMFLFQPVHNSISRSMEYNSDEYGLRLSGVDEITAVTTFDKLSVFNLSDPDPPAIIEFWFYSHPSLSRRIDYVKELYIEIKEEGGNVLKKQEK
jgi:Zn-dependent protease with chaperone function